MMDARSPGLPGRSGPSLASISADAAKAKVLIVDDDPAHRAMLRHIAPHDQIEFVEANGGQQALSLAAAHDFALILTDVRMPGMDGFELAAALAASERSRDVPVIFLTAGEASELSLLRGYAFGAVDYMHKPVNEAALRTKLKVFVELWTSRQQLQGLLAALEERNKKLEEEIAVRHPTVHAHVDQRLAGVGDDRVNQISHLIGHAFESGPGPVGLGGGAGEPENGASSLRVPIGCPKACQGRDKDQF